MRGGPIFILCIFAVSCALTDQQHNQIITIFQQMAESLQEWVGFEKGILHVLDQCKLQTVEEGVAELYTNMQKKGEDFSRDHIDSIRKMFKEKENVKEFFACVVRKRNTKNQYFQQSKRYKYLSQFIREQEKHTKEVFLPGDKPVDKGYRLGRFFRAFFEFYYLQVLHPSETSSTQLIRTMTVLTDVFNHEDISMCLSLETAGEISQNLQGLDIYNIYIKLPQVFNAFKYMKFKKHCQNEKYEKYREQMYKRTHKIDIFKVMYHNSNPYVEIAAEKYGNRQVERVATEFAQMIQNHEHFEALSLQQL